MGNLHVCIFMYPHREDHSERNGYKSKLLALGGSKTAVGLAFVRSDHSSSYSWYGHDFFAGGQDGGQY